MSDRSSSDRKRKREPRELVTVDSEVFDPHQLALQQLASGRIRRKRRPYVAMRFLPEPVRKKRRREQNRLAAAVSRARKRIHTAQLQEQVDALRSENLILRKQVKKFVSNMDNDQDLCVLKKELLLNSRDTPHSKLLTLQNRILVLEEELARERALTATLKKEANGIQTVKGTAVKSSRGRKSSTRGVSPRRRKVKTEPAEDDDVDDSCTSLTAVALPVDCSTGLSGPPSVSTSFRAGFTTSHITCHEITISEVEAPTAVVATTGTAPPKIKTTAAAGTATPPLPVIPSPSPASSEEPHTVPVSVTAVQEAPVALITPSGISGLGSCLAARPTDSDSSHSHHSLVAGKCVSESEPESDLVPIGEAGMLPWVTGQQFNLCGEDGNGDPLSLFPDPGFGGYSGWFGDGLDEVDDAAMPFPPALSLPPEGLFASTTSDRIDPLVTPPFGPRDALLKRESSDDTQ